MNTYTIKYKQDGKTSTHRVMATSAGDAFARCQKLFPEAEMIRAFRSGKWKDGYGETLYDPPPVQRAPETAPKPITPKSADATKVFPFMEET